LGVSLTLNYSTTSKKKMQAFFQKNF